MFLFPYEGGWTETSFRDPERLVRLGQPEYQDACVRAAGRNLYGMPNFRVVELRSRFQRCAAEEFNFWDINGNYHHGETVEAMMPRYREKPDDEDGFIVEAWHYPPWYEVRGFGRDELNQWSVSGKALRLLEPIPARGGYEAIIWDADYPMTFAHRKRIITVNGQPREKGRPTPQTIEEFVRIVAPSLDMSAADRCRGRQEEKARKQQELEDQMVDKVVQKLTIFDGKPGTSMCGSKPIYR